jgi:hypothetical protein
MMLPISTVIFTARSLFFMSTFMLAVTDQKYQDIKKRLAMSSLSCDLGLDGEGCAL